jgi:hypothetical protein
MRKMMMNKMNLLLVLMIVLIILGPIATIWSLNTLFPVLAIPYTFETWVAAVVIAGIIRGDGLSFKGK